MNRPDDSSLTPQQLATVEKCADRLLREASAFDIFPTPVDRILAAAKLTVVEDKFLDNSVLNQFMQMAKSSMGAVKSALSKVLGLLYIPDRLVLLDLSAPPKRKPFLKLHEAGHSTLPHQSKMYALIHDSEDSLDPYITDLFEREANVFAAETLFQGARFASEAHDSSFGMKVPLELSGKFGASNYATFRRYVTTNPSACCVIVLNPPTLGNGNAFNAQIRRTIVSQTFNTIFDPLDFGLEITNAHYLGHLVPARRKMTGRRQIKMHDRNGTSRSCSAEAFNSTHHMFILIRDEGPAPTVSFPSVRFRPSA